MQTKVIEKPMLFSAPMVRAILEGRKIVTRRVIKPQPPHSCSYVMNGAGDHALCFATDTAGPDGAFSGGTVLVPPTGKSVDHRLLCPHPVGSRIWVRETLYCPTEEQAYTADIEMGWRYSADDTPVPITDQYEEWDRKKLHNTCVSIHMPRWASRITLEVTDARVERLQDISEEDAIAEGVEARTGLAFDLSTLEMTERIPQHNHRIGFRQLWDEINGPGSWDRNDWVWVYTFKHLSTEATG